MAKKHDNKTRVAKTLADPETVLKAANAAPVVFNIAAYFSPLYVMRKKGYSWRYLADWLTVFNIEMSHVHLHRLYAKEDARLNKLTRRELMNLGMPPDMIEEIEEKKDPTKRLVAVDPEDERTPDEEEESQ